MVMTFTLHPLSHYKSITEPCARFLLALIEDHFIDFPSHFILSLIDVYRDTTTRDKLIFPSAIMRIICLFSVSISDSPLFTVMGAISAASVQLSEAQFRLKRPQTETTTLLAPSIPSTSAPSSSSGGMMLEAIMAHVERMTARLDTLTTKLYQANTLVSRIA